MNHQILIGEVTGVHGVRGEIKVRPITDDPGRFYELDSVIIRKNGKTVSYDIELVRLHKGSVLLALSDIGDRDQAEKLRGGEVLIDRDDAVDLEEDEFFIADLIGMKVVDREDKPIGKVSDVITTTGSVDTLEIKTSDKKIYVPFRKEYFLDVLPSEEKIMAVIPTVFFEL